MPDPTLQRRRFPRYRADVPATLYLATGVVEGRVVNVSRGGCLFFPALPSEDSPAVKLSLQLDDGLPCLNCKGEIVYSIRDRGTGIAFREISEYNLDRITAFFEKKLAATPKGA